MFFSRFLPFVVFLFLISQVSFGQKLEQDCPYALPICFNTYTQPNAYSGAGRNPDEIGPSSCLSDGERNNVWYTFTAENDGLLGFLITPNDIATDDYDWAVYDLTNHTCADIATTSFIEISCNFAISAGATGATAGGISDRQGAGGTLTNARIPVEEGGIYTIVVSNFSSSQSGYTIDFETHSDVSIFDVTPPILKEELVENANCNEDSIHIQFSENIFCNSLEIADFDISSLLGDYQIKEIFSNVCTLDVSYGRNYTLVLDKGFLAGDSIFVELVGEVEDVCQNIGTGGTIKVGVKKAQQATVTVENACVGQPVTFNVEATGGSTPYKYQYQSPNQFSSTKLEENTYTFFKDSAGVFDYVITVFGRFGCRVEERGSYEVYPLPDASFSSNAVGTFSYEFTRSATDGDSKWTFGFGNGSVDNNPFVTFPAPGAYPINHTVTSINGCENAAQSEVTISSTPDPNDPVYLHIPNSFSPNDDGLNDQWRIVGSGVQDFQLDVYDRWGALVFASRDISVTWDGNTTTNEKAQAGVYTYILKAEFVDGSSKKESGTIHITK